MVGIWFAELTDILNIYTVWAIIYCTLLKIKFINIIIDHVRRLKYWEAWKLSFSYWRQTLWLFFIKWHFTLFILRKCLPNTLDWIIIDFLSTYFSNKNVWPLEEKTCLNSQLKPSLITFPRKRYHNLSWSKNTFSHKIF